jgi:hypothetical protein
MQIPLVVPVYKAKLASDEVTRLNINRLMNPHVVFVLPNRIKEIFKQNHEIKDQIIAFPDYWFTSRESYSKLLLSQSFWCKLAQFEKVLICQTDAILLRSINNLLDLDYSFLGAPWYKPKKCVVFRKNLFVDYKKLFFMRNILVSVGNGGLSLRTPTHALEVIKRYQSDPKMEDLFNGSVNEDIVFAFLFKKFGYKVPDPMIALSFFMEEHSKDLKSLPDINGFHALARYNPNLEKVIFARYSNLLN